MRTSLNGFFLLLFSFFQTGEFSARFLLKLPVDFSNIPVYLLKVPDNLWQIQQASSHSLHLKIYSSHPCCLSTCMWALNDWICSRGVGLFEWTLLQLCVCACVQTPILGGCELTNQHAVTVDLLWAVWCLQAARSESAHSQAASLFFLCISFSALYW